MESVKVKKQVIKNGVMVGYVFQDVGALIAEEQLSLPREERHSSWKAFEYATAEEIEANTPKPKNKGGRPKSTTTEPETK